MNETTAWHTWNAINMYVKSFKTFSLARCKIDSVNCCVNLCFYYLFSFFKLFTYFLLSFFISFSYYYWNLVSVLCFFTLIVNRLNPYVKPWIYYLFSFLKIFTFFVLSFFVFFLLLYFLLQHGFHFVLSLIINRSNLFSKDIKLCLKVLLLFTLKINLLK